MGVPIGFVLTSTKLSTSISIILMPFSLATQLKVRKWRSDPGTVPTGSNPWHMKKLVPAAVAERNPFGPVSMPYPPRKCPFHNTGSPCELQTGKHRLSHFLNLYEFQRQIVLSVGPPAEQHTRYSRHYSGSKADWGEIWRQMQYQRLIV